MQQRQEQRAINLRNTSKYMGASKSMSKDKSMDASNSRADNRRNTFNSMDDSNIMDQSKSMDATNRTNRGNICI
jgi:hypothetical protein